MCLFHQLLFKVAPGCFPERHILTDTFIWSRGCLSVNTKGGTHLKAVFRGSGEAFRGSDRHELGNSTSSVEMFGGKIGDGRCASCLLST